MRIVMSIDDRKVQPGAAWVTPHHIAALKADVGTRDPRGHVLIRFLQAAQRPRSLVETVEVGLFELLETVVAQVYEEKMLDRVVV